MAETCTGADRAAQLRAALVDTLRDERMITSASVKAAVRVVPRERFMPADTPLEAAYGYDSSVVTKRDRHGVAISSVSAAYIQARMLELAELRPGMTVLQVGSGGLNAAYIAEVVGPEGRVVSIDIDPEVIDRAATLLDATGYSSRVRVLVADTEHGVPDEGPFRPGGGMVAAAWTARSTRGYAARCADLHLWLAWYLDGFCRLPADEGAELAGQKRWLPFAVVRGAGFACLMLRDALQGAGAEFGARANGRDGQVGAVALIEQIQAWDRAGRHTPPTFAYWPAGSDRSQIPAGAMVMNKTHGVVTISWPTSS